LALHAPASFGAEDHCHRVGEYDRLLRRHPHAARTLCSLALALWPVHAQAQAAPGPYVSLGEAAAFHEALDAPYGGLSDHGKPNPGEPGHVWVRLQPETKPDLPAHGVVADPAPPGEAASRFYLVFFDWDRTDLSPRARQIVAEAASSFTHARTTRIEVNGYTDLSDSAAYTKRLSRRRGESVQAELVRDGVAREAIAVVGTGEVGPAARQARNRIVEIVLR
jgi:outer membrane protein OmpA-like peptidoglycan-associated protein